MLFSNCNGILLPFLCIRIVILLHCLFLRVHKELQGLRQILKILLLRHHSKKNNRNQKKKRQTKWNNTDMKVDVWFLPTGSNIQSTAICLYRELTLAVLTMLSQSSGHNKQISHLAICKMSITLERLIIKMLAGVPTCAVNMSNLALFIQKRPKIQ